MKNKRLSLVLICLFLIVVCLGIVSNFNVFEAHHPITTFLSVVISVLSVTVSNNLIL